MKKRLLIPLFACTIAIWAISVSTVWAQTDSAAQFKKYPALNMSEEEFASQTINDNKQEIMLAELAIEKSENENVKVIAEMLVKDHNMMNKKLSGIAGEAEQRASSEQSNADFESSEKQNDQPADEKDEVTVEDGRSLPGDTGTASNQLDIAGTKTTRDLDSSSQSSNAASQQQASTSYDPIAMLEDASGAEFDKMWIEQMLIKHKIKLGQLHEARKTYNDPELKNVVTSAIPVIREHRDMLTAVKDNPDEPLKIKHNRNASRNKNAGSTERVSARGNNDAARR